MMFIQLNEFNYCWFYFADGCLFSNLHCAIKCETIYKKHKQKAFNILVITRKRVYNDNDNNFPPLKSIKSAAIEYERVFNHGIFIFLSDQGEI